MKMPALVRAKNTVTVSIIANVLVRAPHANVTTGHAAQSKGFLSGKRQSNPTDDFEQQRRKRRANMQSSGSEHADRRTNAHLDPVNVTAGAAVAINDAQALITGQDFVKKLTENRSLALDGLASSLTAVNSALNLLPPNDPLVHGYDRGRQTLIARTFQ
jgi:hypothetical protein